MTVGHWARSAHPTLRSPVMRYRDLLYWIDRDVAYVVACDSNAGIGERPGDALRKNPTEVGYSAAKVPLMEVLAIGAVPLALTNALGGPLDDYGRRVLAGIEAAVSEIDAEVTISGSDETNMPTRQTAIGVTVIGCAPVSEIRWGTTEPGDVIVVVGRPQDGLITPYAEGQGDVAGLYDLESATRLDFIHELLPVGSRGVAYEADQLAAGIQGQVTLVASPDIDPGASAGASTCFLASLAPVHVPQLRAVTRPPVVELGFITSRSP